MPAWLRALNLFLEIAPTAAEEIAAGLAAHWGKDHVQQIAMGSNLLATVAATVAQAVARNGVSEAATKPAADNAGGAN